MGIAKIKNVVGIDVSKDTLEVIFIHAKEGKHIIKGSHAFTNDFKGHEDLLQWSLKKTKMKEYILLLKLQVFIMKMQ